MLKQLTTNWSHLVTMFCKISINILVWNTGCITQRISYQEWSILLVFSRVIPWRQWVKCFHSPLLPLLQIQILTRFTICAVLSNFVQEWSRIGAVADLGYQFTEDNIQLSTFLDSRSSMFLTQCLSWVSERTCWLSVASLPLLCCL